MISQLAWREPWWLLLAIVPWLWLAWNRKQISAQQDRRAAFADPHLWPYLVTSQHNNTKPSRSYWAGILAWTLAAVAASGPYIEQEAPQTGQGRGIDIAVVIDISPSMTAQDITPNRLERAKLELRDFVSHLHGDRVALIAFSANAYVTLPLTPDKETFLNFADLLDPALVIKQGSNIARALLVARQTLDGAEQQSRGILLITDGEAHNNAATLAEADKLRMAGIPLFILGTGTEAGGPVPDGKGHFMKINGELVVSRLARAQLTSLATLTGGAYADLRSDDGDFRQLFAGLRKLKPAHYTQGYPTQHAYQLFPWFLGASLLLFLWAGVQRGVRGYAASGAFSVLMALPLLGAPNHAYATPWQEQRALEALKANDYARAVTLYRGIKSFNGAMGLGASAYRQRRWEDALTAFKQASRMARSDTERAQAIYNTGNVLVQLTRLDEAAKAYEMALAWQKNYPRAALNLAMVNKEKEFRAGGGRERPKKNPVLTAATQDEENTTGHNPAKTINTVDFPLDFIGPGHETETRNQNSDTAKIRQQIKILRENAQELLSNRFSTVDKFSGILVVEDEKPW